jgi:predicted metal-dependent peptidase
MSVDASVSSDARLRVMAARIIAQQRWPYVSAVLFALRLVKLPVDVMPTMAVDDGWRLYFSDEFVLAQEPEQLATVLLHEAMHCLNQHRKRFDALNQGETLHSLWNYATDAAINETLDEAKMPWPSVEPVRYEMMEEFGVGPQMATEAVFFALLDGMETNQHSSIPDTDCGSVSGGKSRHYELPAADPVLPRVRDEQQDSILDRVAYDIVEHSKYRGNVPGGLLRWAESVLHPQVNWREALASKIRRDLATVSGRRDYSYLRPSRRQEAMRLIGSSVLLPAMRQPAPPRVAVVVDTSGSISDRELRLFASELVGITRASGVSSGVAVIACDAEAHSVQRVRSRSEVEDLSFPGGGGTDLRVGFEAVVEMRPTPHILIVFTDGETPWPEDPPRRIDSTVIVLSEAAGNPEVPEWCTLVRMNDLQAVS